jgi:hypothetical protein
MLSDVPPLFQLKTFSDKHKANLATLLQFIILISSAVSTADSPISSDMLLDVALNFRLWSLSHGVQFNKTRPYRINIFIYH